MPLYTYYHIIWRTRDFICYIIRTGLFFGKKKRNDTLIICINNYPVWTKRERL